MSEQNAENTAATEPQGEFRLEVTDRLLSAIYTGIDVTIEELRAREPGLPLPTLMLSAVAPAAMMLKVIHGLNDQLALTFAQQMGNQFLTNPDLPYHRNKAMFMKVAEEAARRAGEASNAANAAQTEPQPPSRPIAPTPAGAAPESLADVREVRLNGAVEAVDDGRDLYAEWQRGAVIQPGDQRDLPVSAAGMSPEQWQKHSDRYYGVTADGEWPVEPGPDDPAPEPEAEEVGEPAKLSEVVSDLIGEVKLLAKRVDAAAARLQTLSIRVGDQ